MGHVIPNARKLVENAAGQNYVIGTHFYGVNIFSRALAIISVKFTLLLRRYTILAIKRLKIEV